MAYEFTTGTVPQNLVDAHNETHRSTVALEAAKPHYDGPEVNPDGQVQKLTTFYPSTITALATAIDCTEKGISLYNTSHITLGNGGSGKKIYAHKNSGTAFAGSVGPAGAVLEQAMVDAWGPKLLDALTKLKAHLANGGGVWHTAADAFNSLGTLPAAINTKALLCEWTIVLWNVYNAHRIYTSGGVHGAADVDNPLTSAPPNDQDDFDGILAVLIEFWTDYPNHIGDVGGAAPYHALTDTVNTLSGGAPAFPAAVTTAFTRINDFKGTWNTHLGDTGATGHQVADAANTLTSANATTIATYIALAEELRTDQPAHFDNAPTTRAMRNL